MTITQTTIHDEYPTRLAQPGESIPRSQPAVWGAASDGPFDVAQLAVHESRGFTILDDFISAADVRTYRAELDRLSGDESLISDPRRVTEKKTGLVRSVFDVDKLSAPIAALASNPHVLDRARQILGSEVYLHQTRVNFLPSFTGTGFYWHSAGRPSCGGAGPIWMPARRGQATPMTNPIAAMTPTLVHGG